MNKTLQPPDLHHFNAAVGWLELGNHHEAGAELDHIAASLRAHPQVLELRWQIQAGARRWEDCVRVALEMTKAMPQEPPGWIHLSYALHELKRTEEAWNNLIAVVDQFPKEATMRYNLACYACQLGRLPEARIWFKKTLALGRRQVTRLMALKDPDLLALWPEIRKL